MEIQVAKERILIFDNAFTFDEAKQKSWDKKADFFGAVNKMSSFLSKPKDDDFELVYSEHRYQPFWHVIAKARYIYDRSAKYQVPAKSKEVREITILKNKYVVTNGNFIVDVVEHCTQEDTDEILIDGVTGKNQSNLNKYLALSPKAIKDNLESSVPEGSIIVPPQIRASAIVRDAMSKMIKGIQADAILEEHVEVTCVDLFYRPVYAFQYFWKSKNKKAIVEVDGVTGDLNSGEKTFNEYVGKVLDTNFLFDVGADAAGMFIPGGSIAVKVAKKYMDNRSGQQILQK